MKKVLLCVFCIGIALSLSGCWDAREPKDLLMMNSILYDVTEDSKASISMEIMNPSAQSKSENTIIIETEGKTYSETLRQEAKSTNKLLFAGFNRVRFFSEKLAKQGLNSILDYFARDYITDQGPLMIVVQGDEPQRIYQCDTGLSDMMGNNLKSMSFTQPKNINESVFTNGLEFAKAYYEEGIQPVMGLVKIMSDGKMAVVPPTEQPSSPSSGGSLTNSGGGGGSASGSGQGASQNTAGNQVQYYIRYEGLAAFKDVYLVGFMNGEEARAYNIVRKRFTVGVQAVKVGDGYITGQIGKAKVKIKTSLKDKKWQFDIKVKAGIYILQVDDPSLDLLQADVIRQIEQKFNLVLKDQITASVNKAQKEFISDIFGFGVYVHRQHPQEWEKIKQDWDNLFAEAKVNVVVTTTIDKEGAFKQPYTTEEKTDEW